VVQMRDVLYFTSNNKTHPAFGKALVAAEKAGVEVIALDCEVTEDSLTIGDGDTFLTVCKELSQQGSVHIVQITKEGDIQAEWNEDTGEIKGPFIYSLHKTGNNVYLIVAGVDNIFLDYSERKKITIIQKIGGTYPSPFLIR